MVDYTVVLLVYNEIEWRVFREALFRFSAYF